MQKGKAVSVRQEIRKEVEKVQYASLSELISEAIQLRLKK